MSYAVTIIRFFFNDTATTEIYTLSLHDALPILMRALGFQRGQVRFAFLIESSFVALLGLGFGVALGLAFSGTLIDNIREGFPGLEYRVPWSALVLVIVVGYAASLVTTYLPARRADRKS